jgi:outer membrane protein
VDLAKIWDGYWKTKEAKANIKDRNAEAEKSVKDMNDELVKARDEYQKLAASAEDSAISADERERRKKAAEDKLRDVKERNDRMQEAVTQEKVALQDQVQRMTERLLEEIQAAVAAKAKAANYAMVLDSSAKVGNGTSVVLFTSGENDLTDQVLSQLNSARINIPGAGETNKPADSKK